MKSSTYSGVVETSKSGFFGHLDSYALHGQSITIFGERQPGKAGLHATPIRHT
jgi:hypothetical protein